MMKEIRSLLLLLLMFTLLMSTASAADNPYAEDPAESGEAQYLTSCMLCHDSYGTGRGPYAKNLKMPPTDLTQLANSNGGVFPEARVRRVLSGDIMVSPHGPSEMPIWGEQFRQLGAHAQQVDPDIDPDEYAEQRMYVLIEFLKAIQSNRQ